MLQGQRVEYQTGWADFGIGIIVAIDAEREIVTVIDEDDGSKWRGPLDRVSSPTSS